MAIGLFNLMFGLILLAAGVLLIWFRRGLTQFFVDLQKRMAGALKSDRAQRAFLGAQARQTTRNTLLVGVAALVMGSASVASVFFPNATR